MSYKKALQIKEYSKDIVYEQLVKKIGDFGFKLPLYDFQVKGLLYLYQGKRTILADATGLGKTVQILALFSLLDYLKKEDNRWILVVPPSVILQWAIEWKRFTALEAPILCIGNRRERVGHYMMRTGKAYIMSYQVLWRDWELVAELGIPNYIFDDAHFFRHHCTKTAGLIKMLSKQATRIVLSTATPIMKDVRDLHSLLEALGLHQVFGSLIGFENHYCQVRKTHHILRDGRTFWKKQVVGLRNCSELKRKLKPFYIMRTFNDVGKELPELIVKTIHLRLHKDQQVIHEQLRQRLIRAWDTGEFRTVRNKGFHSMRQICSGTQTVGFEKDVSIKLDAVEQFIRDKLGKEKVIVYTFYKQTVRSIVARLKKMGYTGFEFITGDMNDKRERERIKQRFLTDPSCQVLVGTDAIKTGLNLQSARYLLMVDILLNPKEVVQLVGRMRRLGSKETHVVLYVLLCKGTIEEGLWRRLKYESAISSIIFGKKDEVFPSLSDLELLTLVKGSGNYNG